MNVESYFAMVELSVLGPGDLFFLPGPEGNYSPSMKVTTASRQIMIVDFDAELQNGARGPVLFNAPDDLNEQMVISVPNALIRFPELKKINIGTMASPPMGALMIYPVGTIIKVSYQNRQSLRFRIDNCDQATGQTWEGSDYAWTASWDIIVRDAENKSTVLFSRSS